MRHTLILEEAPERAIAGCDGCCFYEGHLTCNIPRVISLALTCVGRDRADGAGIIFELVEHTKCSS